jgi:hypothetical protein
MQSEEFIFIWNCWVKKRAPDFHAVFDEREKIKRPARRKPGQPFFCAANLN